MEDRVLVLAPSRRDAEMCAALLSGAGLSFFLCADLSELCRELPAGAAALLLTDEVLSPHQVADLRVALANQPGWSELPVLLLTRGGHEAPARSMMNAECGGLLRLHAT